MTVYKRKYLEAHEILLKLCSQQNMPSDKILVRIADVYHCCDLLKVMTFTKQKLVSICMKKYMKESLMPKLFHKTNFQKNYSNS